jgi:hypothetical protein
MSDHDRRNDKPNGEAGDPSKRRYEKPALVDFLQEPTVYFDSQDPGNMRGQRRGTTPRR